MTNSKLKLIQVKPSLSSSVLKNKEKSSKIYSLYYYLNMTHFLKHSLEIWDSFFIVILTSNDKSLRLAKYASITYVTFGVLGRTLALKLKNYVALVTSHLDYCNSLLYNLPDRDIERLHRVQNCLARVVCKASRFSRSKPRLNFLHWLPVKYRIRFKLCTITFKAFLFHQPTYLFNYLVPLQNS